MLIRLLDDPDLGFSAERSLAQLGVPDTLPILFARYEAGSRIGRGSAATNFETAALAAVELDHRRVVDHLLAELPLSRGLMRASIIDVLGKLGDSRAVGPLVTLLEGRKFRNVALQALVRIDDPTALPAMKQASRRIIIRRCKRRRQVVEMERRHP